MDEISSWQEPHQFQKEYLTRRLKTRNLYSHLVLEIKEVKTYLTIKLSLAVHRKEETFRSTRKSIRSKIRIML